MFSLRLSLFGCSCLSWIDGHTEDFPAHISFFIVSTWGHFFLPILNFKKQIIHSDASGELHLE